tara:strand:+ start:2217 stop:2492 length:276 start_codon:yes stop_codon:yes gene_type:complete
MSKKDIDLKAWFSQNGISIRYEWMSLQEYEINGYRQAYVTARVKASSFQNAREQAEEALLNSEDYLLEEVFGTTYVSRCSDNKTKTYCTSL